MNGSRSIARDASITMSGKRTASGIQSVNKGDAQGLLRERTKGDKK
jgi:hypothetical protein